MCSEVDVDVVAAQARNRSEEGTEREKDRENESDFVVGWLNISVKKKDNAYRVVITITGSRHVEQFRYSQGELTGGVRAIMKEKAYFAVSRARDLS